MVKSAIQASNLADFSAEYSLNPFALRLGPLLTEVLAQVEQELYAMMIVYNLLRELMLQAATPVQKDPQLISFLDCLQLVIDAVPHMSQPLPVPELAHQHQYLRSLNCSSRYRSPPKSAGE